AGGGGARGRPRLPRGARAAELLGGGVLTRGLALGLIERVEASADKALVIRLRCADITKKR
ncbi:hypothetical protein, partial [Anaerotruncus massiliensis (ex Liu et al. 2021)]|uniref:hypothetical protein n=1 Tax=Anaerotruncus massiliensis (ex Liu et al. 2021) TaxID=2321404 RepID=UPI003AF11125